MKRQTARPAKKGRTKFGKAFETALKEVQAYRRGEIALPVRIVQTMKPDEVKEIRRSVASSPKEFERRFGVPARTVENWEQGRGMDAASRVLLRVIAKNPKAVEDAVRQ